MTSKYCFFDFWPSHPPGSRSDAQPMTIGLPCVRLPQGEHWEERSPRSEGQGRKQTRAPIVMEAVPEKTTIREVALAAGVGIGTISRVLNSSSQVSRKTRAR